MKIKQLRELKNFTQEYIAQQLDLSTRAYSKIESGETQLTINRLNEISKILEIDPFEILRFDHNNIFNNCSQEGNYNTIGTTTFQIPEKLIQQYEKQFRSWKMK
jgi:transcriptional regulator with XRE-family HTH domain